MCFVHFAGQCCNLNEPGPKLVYAPAILGVLYSRFGINLVAILVVLHDNNLSVLILLLLLTFALPTQSHPGYSALPQTHQRLDASQRHQAKQGSYQSLDASDILHQFLNGVDKPLDLLPSVSDKTQVWPVVLTLPLVKISFVPISAAISARSTLQW